MKDSTAYKLDQMAIKWGYKTYWDKDFLKFTKVESLEQTEKDRIFNELIVSAEILAIATLKNSDRNEESEKIAPAHSEFMKELGIEKQYRDIWVKLISLRFDEFERDKNNARMAMIEFESKEKDITSMDIPEINLLIPPFEIAVMCHKHVLRGKTKGQDNLFKLIHKSMSRFYMEINFAIPDKKVSPLTKNKIRLRHLWNDIKEKVNKN